MSDDKPAPTESEMAALIERVNRSPNIPDRFAALEARMERLERAFVLRENLSHGNDLWCESHEFMARQGVELQATLYAIRCGLRDRERKGSGNG